MERTDAKAHQRLPLKRTSFKVIALDFDDTLIESNNIKDQAFKTIFSDWPDHQETMMEWHLAHDAIDRQEKFRYFVKDVLGLPDRDNLIAELAKRFSMLTKQSVIDCPLVQGVRAFLENTHCRVAVYLLSATPQLYLNEIIEERGLGKYFKEVFGAPIDKVEILKKIMASEKISAGEILFIGDSPEDQQAAASLEIFFIGRRSERQLDDSTSPVLPDFAKIKDYLCKYYGL